MSDNLKAKVNSLGGLLKVGGSEVGRKMSAGMSSVSFKVKEFFHDPSQEDKLVGDATSEALNHPNWAIILHICDLINADKLSTAELVRAIQKRVATKTSPITQYLALVLLEALVKNCDKAFLEVATERVLDEMVKLIHDPHTLVNNRNKALSMIQLWGDFTAELRYLPVFAQTYKSLKSRGIRFPGRDNESSVPTFAPSRPASAPPEADVQSFTSERRKEAFAVARNSVELLYVVLSSSTQKDVSKDDLTTTLVQQCRDSQSNVHRIVETIGDNEAVLCEALSVNDEIEKVLSKYEELKKKPAKTVVPLEPEPAMIPVAVAADESPLFAKEDALIRRPSGSRVRHHHDDMIDDLDEMIFGKKGAGGQHQSSEHNLISL